MTEQTKKFQKWSLRQAQVCPKTTAATKQKNGHSQFPHIWYLVQARLRKQHGNWKSHLRFQFFRQRVNHSIIWTTLQVKSMVNIYPRNPTDRSVFWTQNIYAVLHIIWWHFWAVSPCSLHQTHPAYWQPFAIANVRSSAKTASFMTNRFKYTVYWLVVDLPLWKIWVRQLGWWNSQ